MYVHLFKLYVCTIVHIICMHATMTLRTQLTNYLRALDVIR